MLIPIGHENMTVRRLPIITICLIMLNVFAFLATNGKLGAEGPEMGRLRVHIILLAAMHPELETPAE
jgi:hypothetical protein